MSRFGGVGLRDMPSKSWVLIQGAFLVRVLDSQGVLPAPLKPGLGGLAAGFLTFPKKMMATKPLTSEAIVLTEKKMDMTLDDIIKMSKNNSTKAKKQRRAPNKSQKVFNNAVKDKALKVQQFMGSRSSLRQGVLAQRRSNFQGNHFPLATEAAQMAAVAAVRNRAFNGSMVANKMNRARVGALPVQRRASNGGFSAKRHQQQQHRQLRHQLQQWQEDNTVPKQRSQTLDSLFANMKEQRMKAFPRPNTGGGVQRNGGGRPRVPWARGRFGN